MAAKALTERRRKVGLDPKPQPRFRRLRADVEPGPRVATCCRADDAESRASRRHHAGLDHVGRRLDLLGQPVLQRTILSPSVSPDGTWSSRGYRPISSRGGRRSRQRANAIRARSTSALRLLSRAWLCSAQVKCGPARTLQNTGSAVCGRRPAGGNGNGNGNGNGPIISALRYPRSASEVAPVLWSAAAMRGFRNGLSRDISQQPAAGGRRPARQREAYCCHACCPELNPLTSAEQALPGRGRRAQRFHCAARLNSSAAASAAGSIRPGSS